MSRLLAPIAFTLVVGAAYGAAIGVTWPPWCNFHRSNALPFNSTKLAGQTVELPEIEP